MTDLEFLRREHKDIYNSLVSQGKMLESHYQDMQVKQSKENNLFTLFSNQEIEFLVESGKLFLLKARVGERSAKVINTNVDTLIYRRDLELSNCQAQLSILVSLVQEEILSKKDAILRINIKDTKFFELDTINQNGYCFNC